MEPTQEQVNAYIGALIAAQVTPEQLGAVMQAAVLLIQRASLEAGLETVELTRAQTQAQLDAEYQALVDQLDLVREQIRQLAQ